MRSFSSRSSSGQVQMRRLVTAALAVVGAIGATRSASAAVDLFLPLTGTSGTWEDGNNWLAGAPPTSSDDAFIDSGFTATSTGVNTCVELQVGVGPNAYGSRGNPGGKGQLDINAGSLTALGNLVVGQAQDPNVDSSGIINVNTGATFTVNGSNSLVGFFGDNSAGLNFPTTGTINVNGGTFAWNGGDAHATLWLGGDSVGPNQVGKGTLNVNTGTATGGAIRVGDYGSGTLNVTGGTLNANFYMAIGLGNNPNQGHGTVNVSGGVLNLAQVTLNENKTEECVFTQSGGTVNIGSVHGLDGYNFRVGYSDHGKGTYNITGGTLNVSGNDLYVGRGLNGEMNISGTAAVNVNTIAVDDRPNADFAVALGGIDNGTAVINQNGGTVFIAPTSLLGVFYHGANGGTETYNLAGGSLTTNGISVEGGSTVKTFNFNGGTLIANKSFAVPNPTWSTPANFITTLSAGGATIDTAGFDVTWNNALTGSGALTKIGAGSLTLAAANSYSGNTVVSAGTLIVSNPVGSSGTGTGSVTVASGATLGGTGSVGGAATINGTLAPGAADATGSITFASTLTTGSASSTAIGLASPTDVDHIAAVGAATLAGQLQLSTSGGYVPAFGQTHRVLDAGSISGHFSSVAGNQLSTNRWLAVTYDASGVNVTAALPGDANLSTKVDFTDLLALAKSYGKSNQVWAQGDFDGNGTVNFSDLLALAKNYNQTAPADAAVPANISADWALAQSLAPEPAALAGLLAAGLAFSSRRRAATR